MKIKRAILILLLLILLLCGCKDLSLPIYELGDSLQVNESVSVIIDGIKYETMPELKWLIKIERTEVIGYAGSKNIEILSIYNDTKRNYVFLNDLKQSGLDKQLAVLYRTDIEIPQPSSTSVNMISYYEQDFREDNIKRNSNNVTDKKIIQLFFETLNSKVKITNVSGIKGIAISISCFSDLLSGAVYILSIGEHDGKLMCGNESEGYVEISTELMGKLAGYRAENKLLNAQ